MRNKCGRSKMTPRAAIHGERRMYLNFNLRKHWDSSKSDDPRDFTARKDRWSGREKCGIQRSNNIKKFQDRA